MPSFLFFGIEGKIFGRMTPIMDKFQEKDFKFWNFFLIRTKQLGLFYRNFKFILISRELQHCLGSIQIQHQIFRQVGKAASDFTRQAYVVKYLIGVGRQVKNTQKNLTSYVNAPFIYFQFRFQNSANLSLISDVMLTYMAWQQQEARRMGK